MLPSDNLIYNIQMLLFPFIGEETKVWAFWVICARNTREWDCSWLSSPLWLRLGLQTEAYSSEPPPLGKSKIFPPFFPLSLHNAYVQFRHSKWSLWLELDPNSLWGQVGSEEWVIRGVERGAWGRLLQPWWWVMATLLSSDFLGL